MITLKNTVPDIDELIIFVMCAFIVGWTVIMIVFTIIRLYYDLRYGEALEIKLKE